MPIERFIVNIMDEVPLPDLGTNMVVYDDSINFYRPIDQYPPYADVSIKLLPRFLFSSFYARPLRFKICLKPLMWLV